MPSAYPSAAPTALPRLHTLGWPPGILKRAGGLLVKHLEGKEPFRKQLGAVVWDETRKTAVRARRGRVMVESTRGGVLGRRTGRCTRAFGTGGRRR